MATSTGNRGSFVIEVEDGTTEGIAKVLKSVAGLQQKAAKEESEASAAAKKAKQEEIALEKKAKEEKVEKAKAEKEAARVAKENAELQAASLRAQGNEIRRVGETTKQTTQQRLAAQMQILQIEQQALKVEREAADTALRRLQIDEQLKDNAARQKSVANELGAQGEKVQFMGMEMGKLGGYAAAAAAAVYTFVEAIRAADQAMQTAFTQRQILQNIPFTIDKARAATMGFVDDVQLSKLAIEAQRLGVSQSSEAFAQMTLAATKLGFSVGQDAPEAIESLVGALGRGETELLDNLGVTLRTAEAQRLYAKQLGISEKALTEEQKAEAFRVIGLQKALEAADKVNITMNSSEQAWIGARQQWDKLTREALPEATKRMEGAWITFQQGGEFIEKIIPILGRYVDGVITGLRPVIWLLEKNADALGVLFEAADQLTGAMGRGAEKVGEFAGEIKDWAADTSAGQWIAETSSAVSEFASKSLADLRVAAEENIPYAEELGDAWDRTANSIFGASEAIGKLGLNPAKQLNELMQKGAALAKQAKADESSKLLSMTNNVKALDHQIKLAEAQKKPHKEIEKLLREQFAARVKLLFAQGKEAEAQQAILDEQVRRAKEANKGGGPTAAERWKAEHEGAVQLLADEAKIVAARKELMQLYGAAQSNGLEVARMKYNAELAALDLERQVLELTKAKTSIEKQQIENKLAALGRERELLGLEFEIEQRKIAAEEEKKASEETKKRLTSEAKEIQYNAALEVKRGQDEEQRIQQQGAAEIANANSSRQKMLAQMGMEDDLHRKRMQNIEAQYQAQLAAFKVTEAGLDPANADAARQLAHDKQMARIDFEMQKNAELEAQKVRIANNDKMRLQQTIAEINEYMGAIQGVVSQVSGVISTELGRQRSIEDEQHQARIQKMNDEGAATLAAYDAQINLAKGNDAKMAQLKAAKAKFEEANRKKIEKAEKKHNDKRQKQEMRASGTMLIIQGVVEIGKAAAAFASQNYVEGAAHVAAAALNIGYGAALVSGKIPAAGGAGGGGASAGGDGGSGVGTEKESSAAAKTPESVPGEAAKKNSNMAQSKHDMEKAGSTTVIINGNISATGKMDGETVEKIGLSIGRASRSREGAGS